MTDDFNLCLKAVKNLLDDSSSLTLQKLTSISQSLTVKDKKSVIDLAFRDKMLHFLASNATEDMKSLLKMSVAAAVAKICSAATPFLLFADLINTKPISDAEENFHFMEQTITALKDVSLFGPGRNVLLRMCNDLLRRLSKSQNTVFCGRIQLFLTRLFPIDEKSGLNLVSHFNADKEIAYSKDPDESLFQSIVNTTSEAEVTPEKALVDLQVNVKLYNKFWLLQEYLKSPTLCYAKEGWVNFTECTECVIDTFTSIRLADSEDCDRRWKATGTKFTTYLTSEKLFDLQLMDSSFRHYILVQLLIIFQYLSTQVKFKSAAQTLNDSQNKWLDCKREAVCRLLGGTGDPEVDIISPDVSRTFAVVSHVLERETHWNRWKNEGCPSYIRSPVKSVLPPRKRRINPLIDKSGRKVFRFANRDLDRLWSLCPDNLEACKDKNHLFQPDINKFFEDAIREMDPVEKVEEEYKFINREEWTWRALRLLSRRCSYFFTNWVFPGKTIKEYLTSIFKEGLNPEDNMKINNGETASSVAKAADENPTPSAAATFVKPSPRSTGATVPLTKSGSKYAGKQTTPVSNGRSSHVDRDTLAGMSDRSRPSLSSTPVPAASSNTTYLDSTSTILETSAENFTSISRLSDTDGEADDLEDEEDGDAEEEFEDRETMEIN